MIGAAVSQHFSSTLGKLPWIEKHAMQCQLITFDTLLLPEYNNYWLSNLCDKYIWVLFMHWLRIQFRVIRNGWHRFSCLRGYNKWHADRSATVCLQGRFHRIRSIKNRLLITEWVAYRCRSYFQVLQMNVSIPSIEMEWLWKTASSWHALKNIKSMCTSSPCMPKRRT